MLVEQFNAFVAKLIRSKYKDIDISVPINSSSRFAAGPINILLKECPIDAVPQLIANKTINLNELIQTDKDKKIYLSYIYRASYSGEAIEFLKQKFYMNEIDKQQLRNSLWEDEYTCYHILMSDTLQQDLNITKKERDYCIDKLLMRLRFYEDVIRSHFDYFDQEKVLLLLYSDRDEALVILNMNNIPFDFKKRIVLQIFDIHKDAYLIWNYINKDKNNTIRQFVFNQLMQYSDIKYKNLFDNDTILTDSEKEIIYEHFHDEIFEDIKSSFVAFYETCKKFGKYISSDIKNLLIKKLKTKTRHSYIYEAKRYINFSERELAQLDAILLAYELRKS